MVSPGYRTNLRSGIENLRRKPEAWIQRVTPRKSGRIIIFRIDGRGDSPYHHRMKDDDSDPPAPVERSATAREVSKLQDTVRRLVEEREVLPQPLFWSLFNSRLSDIKKQKEVSRLLRGALDGVGDL